jgi:hypothetical protein
MKPILTSLLLIAVVAILTLLVAQKSKGQGIDTDPSRPLIHQAGEIFVVRIAPGTSLFDVVAVGKPIVVLDPTKIEVFGRVFELDGRRRQFAIRWRNGYYEIAEPVDSRLKMEIEVVEPSTQKSETFEFNPPLPYF